MGADRAAHPFDLLFAGFRESRFPAIRAEIGARADLADFMLSAAAAELMGELRPDEGLGEGIDEFVALVHAAYRYWCDGEQTTRLDAATTLALCEPDAAAPTPSGDGVVRYVQVAPRLIWARLTDETSFEPLDGWFAVPIPIGLRVVACLGIHPARPGVSVVTVEGTASTLQSRADGTAPFAPTMSGGDLAGLRAIATPQELLWLSFQALRREE
ncbi:MAG: hypothetical protein ACREK8_01260 [Gemmatimonadales bacterium]